MKQPTEAAMEAAIPIVEAGYAGFVFDGRKVTDGTAYAEVALIIDHVTRLPEKEAALEQFLDLFCINDNANVRQACDDASAALKGA